MEIKQSFWERRYAVLGAVVLCLAAFNLTFRLGSEIVTEWDESLYAISAWEMLHNHNWIATTFMGSLDYYNTKPPLNVWLIALSFKAFGASLVSLRISAIACAWGTVAVLQWWAKRTLGSRVALVASLILATTFGFIYDHAGRSGNTDAVFTLLILLTVVTLWAAQERVWRVVWLGPIAAAVFLLRGMAVLMPLSIVAVVELWRWRHARPTRLWPLAVAALSGAVPVAAWLVARWRIDRWAFILRIVSYDFIARTVRVIEDHYGGPFYYVNILQRNQLEWVIVGCAVLIASGLRARRVASAFAFWRSEHETEMLLIAWGALSFAIPTIMRTKLSWYLVPFYPVFALAVAFLFVRSLDTARAQPVRAATIACIFSLGLVAAEARLAWYSFNRRALDNSSQGVLLDQRLTLAGQQVYRRHWTHSEEFLLKSIVGAEHREAGSLEEFLRKSRVGDYFFSTREDEHPDLQLVTSRGPYKLFRRRAKPASRPEV